MTHLKRHAASLSHELNSRHDDTRNTHIRTQPLADPGALPERPNKVVLLVAVHDSWEDGVKVGGCADGEEKHQEEGLEVEEGGHFDSSVGCDDG